MLGSDRSSPAYVGHNYCEAVILHKFRVAESLVLSQCVHLWETNYTTRKIIYSSLFLNEARLKAFLIFLCCDAT